MGWQREWVREAAGKTWRAEDYFMDAMNRYFEETLRQLARIRAEQWASLEKAAEWVGEALALDHWLYAFGTGHSHLLAEEIFYRAGGLARGVPMLDSNLMLHHEAIEATYVERREGYAAEIMELYPVEAGDVLIVASNSGRNAVPIEMAIEGRRRGMKVIALVNLAHSGDWPSRHTSGKKLADAADLVLDNCGVSGDACLEMANVPTKVGPTSTVTGAMIINLIIVGAIERAVGRGVMPEIFISSNSNGDDHNDRLLRKYKSRIRHL